MIFDQKQIDQQNFICVYCSRGIKHTEIIWKKRGSRKKKHQKTVPYHKKCWSRKVSATKRSQRKASNPVGRYGAKTGG